MDRPERKFAASVERARAHVARVRASTVCEICGKQPIEWHHDDHVEKPSRRVSTMAENGRPIEEIQAEIDRCTPVCRGCHQAIDGRDQLIKDRFERYLQTHRHPQERLTPEQVRDIRFHYAHGAKVIRLAEEYGVSRKTIRWVVQRRTYQDVD